MVERGDLLALHEPFCNLMDHGETDVDGRIERSAAELRAWLLAAEQPVFFKDTTDRRHPETIADQRFLTEVRHTFLVRDPAEIAASHYALRPEMDADEIGLVALLELHDAVVAAGGHPPVVVASDDLADRPEATMAAYCRAVGLPFRADALSWAPGERSEWRRTQRWHADVAESGGIVRRPQRYEHTVDTNEFLADAAARHRPAYETLVAQRITPIEAGS